MIDIDKNAKMEHQLEHDVALDMWSRGFRNIKQDCGSYDMLIEKGVDIELTQEILNQNYDAWTENMHYCFEKEKALQELVGIKYY